MVTIISIIIIIKFCIRPVMHNVIVHYLLTDAQTDPEQLCLAASKD